MLLPRDYILGARVFYVRFGRMFLFFWMSVVSAAQGIVLVWRYLC